MFLKSPLVIIRSMSNVVKLVKTPSAHVDIDQATLACECLNKGGVVAVPTDTIYGLAAKVDNSKALEQLYTIKGRDKSKPLALSLSSVEEIENVADISYLPPTLLSTLLPGPLTILLKRKKELNPNFNPGVETVGIRVPDQNFLSVVNKFVGPIALTSANLSGEPNPRVVEDFKNLWPQLDYVFDFGNLRMSLLLEQSGQMLGSTVIDLTQPKIYSITREGSGMNRAVNILTRLGYRKKKSANY